MSSNIENISNISANGRLIN
ncbi:Protein of unknown function [Bacillus cereus]|nr:Protein of unknown function [Bacillus cereus]